MELKSERKRVYYKCGRCSANVPYLLKDGRPDVCPQCGYGWYTRDVNDIPKDLRLNLNNLANEDSGSRGISEDSTITSR